MNDQYFLHMFFHFSSFLSQIFLCNYFYLRYLTPKNKQQAIIYTSLIYFVYILLVTLFAYKNTLLRIFSNLFMLTFFAVYFYQDSPFKKIRAGFFMFIFNAISDIISQYIIIFILGYTIFLEIPLGIFICLLLFSILLIFLTIQFFLHFFASKVSISTRYSRLYTALSILQCLLTIILLYSFIFNGLIVRYPSDSPEQSKLIFILFIIFYALCSILCIRYILHSTITLQKDITKELLIQSLNDLYLKQLNEYSNSKNTHDEQMKYLRHDIMNYLQTIHTHQQKENSDE